MSSCTYYNPLVYLPQLRETSALHYSISGWEMFVFVPFRWGEKSRVCFAVVVSLWLALFVPRIEQWFSDMCFDLPQSSAIWCLTSAESWCCEIECSGWALSRRAKHLLLAAGDRSLFSFSAGLNGGASLLLHQHLSLSRSLSFCFIYFLLFCLLSVSPPAVSPVAVVTCKNCWLWGQLNLFTWPVDSVRLSFPFSWIKQ